MVDGSERDIWNEVGNAWVRHAEHYDATLEPFGRAVMDRLALQPGERVFDVGGGAGATTIELARRVAPGEVVSIDMSAPMVTEARRRIDAAGLTNARALLGEVQLIGERADLGGRFDVAFSRMGVMFFEDPPEAFGVIASALVPGGRFGFVCFAELDANPFMAVPVLAVLGILPMDLPAPGAPGPFSLADPHRIERLLGDSGFEDVRIETGPTEADLGSADDLDTLALRLLEQNPSTAAGLAAADPDARQAACAAASRALGDLRHGDRIAGAAKTWVVTARTVDPEHRS